MAVAKTFTVTVATGSRYIVGGTGDVFYIDGSRNNPPTEDWIRGATSRWDQSDLSNNNHPLLFSNNIDNLEAGRITSGVTYYLDGVVTFADWTNLTTFNAATTRYIEFTPDQSLGLTQNAPYYYCYVHGIGMGGPINLLEDVYGAGYFGYGNYNDQANTDAGTISGFSLTTNQGQANYTPTSGWDAYAYGQGNWGEIPNSDITLTGLSATFSLGQVEQSSSSGWGRSTWGSQVWSGYGDVIPEGVSATFNIGDVTIDNEIISGWGGSPWGNTGWGAYGDVLLSGISLSTNLGSVSIDNQINIGWGSDTWGYETWGASGLIVSPTGIEATFNIGTLGVSADASTGELTGQQLTTTVDDVEAFASFTEEVTGQQMTMTLQYSEVVINAVGFGLTMQEGDETATPNTIAEVSSLSPVTWGNSAWGYGVYGNQPVTTLAMSMQEGDVDPAPDAMVTGNAAAMFVGDETVTGDANTGTITNINWGEQAWGESTWGNGTYFDATGYAQAATISLGTVVADPNSIAFITGQLMTMQEGDEGTTANARVNVNGNNLTTATGTVYNLIWNEVNTGTTSIWSEVDTAA